MITAVKTKRGGESVDATETIIAATRKQKVGDSHSGNARDAADLANGLAEESVKPTVVSRVRSKSKVGERNVAIGIARADLPSGGLHSDTDGPAAAGETTNGRASGPMTPTTTVNSRSKTKRGAGERFAETDTGCAGSADTENGAAVRPTKPIVRASRRSKTRGKGEPAAATGLACARPAKTNGRAISDEKTNAKLHGQPADGDLAAVTEHCSAICRQLSPLQRARYTAIRMRIRVDNGIGSYIASQLGDGADKSEADRQRIRKVADELVGCVWKAKPLKHPEHEAVIAANLGMIEAAGIASNAFQGQIDRIAKAMESLAKQLPIAKWLDLPEQKGIGLLSVAAIIGECGTDHGQLPDYRNPSCVWKRMGCAPYQGKMASTWRSGKEGKASAEDWVAMGYCPRRRSVMYVIGEGIVKQNGVINPKAVKNDGAEPIVGPYRKRYDEAKAKFHEVHPDYSDGRCHSHGMLLASKLLLKNLWIEMRKS